MKDLSLSLTVNEINLILKSLGNLPYYQVVSLIDKLQQQANQQIAQSNGSGLPFKERTEEIINQQ
jgi:hypothetical protein